MLLVIGLVWDFVVFFVSFLVLDCILVIEVFFFFGDLIFEILSNFFFFDFISFNRYFYCFSYL